MLAPPSDLLRAGLALKLNQIKLATRSYLRDRTNQATGTVTAYAVAGGLFAVAHVTLDRAPAVCRRCPRQSARVRCARGRRVADATKFIRVDRGVIETAVRGLLQFHRAVDGGRERQWPRCRRVHGAVADPREGARAPGLLTYDLILEGGTRC